MIADPAERSPGRSDVTDAIGVRVMADALAHAGAQRLVVVDPHTAALEAMCAIPAEMLTAVPALTRVLETEMPAEAVVVALDLGAAKLAQHYAALLSRPVAVVLRIFSSLYSSTQRSSKRRMRSI
ncbi:hypothetical protein [Microtetraspora malaysiensis]|uniref:hypothetical protein n=1 Tax=Microtetraspora malaysiensis TaxID=161358 RepID=UPI003D8A0125